ncbi:MAG: hypothetical protein EXS12_06180 [Phycisphaerales bacterium]|nr:hypothetical protein [Phycisphaerales bacterium]
MHTRTHYFQQRAPAFKLAAMLVYAACACVNLAQASDFTSPVQPSANSVLNLRQGVMAKQDLEGVLEVSLDPALVEQLPKRGQFNLLGFPVGKGQTIDLELKHMDVKLADAHAVCSYPGLNNQPIAQPTFGLGDAVQFSGSMLGDEGSKAFISFSSTANIGIFIASNGMTYIMSDGEVNNRGPLVVTSMSELPPGIIDWKPFSCAADTSVLAPDFDFDETPDAAYSNAVAGCKVATVYIDTDYQLYVKLGQSQTALTNYILQMVGAANIIYYKDLQIDLRLAGWFIYTTDASDGFGAYTDSSSALDDVQSKWQAAPYNTYSRTLVSYLTSQTVGGGVAWMSQLCSKTLGFSMCGNLDGSFPYPLSLRSSQNWDIMVFCHELGHNFSAPHTHDLGLDNCYTSSGIGSCVAPDGNYPPIGGTIMSYCHLCPGGTSNNNMIFHYGNVTGMKSYIAGKTCLGSCGSMTITATQNQTEQVSLAWTTDPSAISYTVFRRLPDTTSPKDLTLPVAITTTTSASLIDASMVCDKNYEYYVRANYTTASTGPATGMMSDIQIGKALCSTAVANLVAWGINTYGERTIPAGVVATSIAAGYNHSAALKQNGSVICWGNNAYGQSTAPTTIIGALQVAGGYRHSAALKSNNTVECWGAGKSIGSSPNFGQSIVPTNLTAVTNIAAGAYHTLARKSDGTLVCWGSNLQGQCTLPTGVTNNVLQGAAGYFHTLILLNDNTVRGCGYNFNGQISIPADLTGVVKIASGAYHGLALKNNGTVVCWGAGLTNTGATNNWGQSMVPSDVTNVVEISGGGKHTVVRLGNGIIRSWGYNTSWQCNSPEGYRAQSISAGFEFTLGMFNQTDADNDGIIGYLDNCPTTANANQTDCDADGYGDICAIATNVVADLDGNGVPDPCQYAYGDLDLDGEVGSGDVGLILLSIGESGDLIEDINNDNVVDSADVGLALLNYGPVP